MSRRPGSANPRGRKPSSAQGGTGDEPTVRMLITEVLEELGCVSIEAADRTAALPIMQADMRIDLLITDVGLPNGMNSRQVADAGRLSGRTCASCSLAVTRKMRPSATGSSTPACTCCKPLAMDVLAARIREQTGGPHPPRRVLASLSLARSRISGRRSAADGYQSHIRVMETRVKLLWLLGTIDKWSDCRKLLACL